MTKTERVRIREGWIELDPKGTGDFFYDIELDRIRNQDQLHRWIDHLTEKNWFTPRINEEFTRLVIGSWGQ